MFLNSKLKNWAEAELLSESQIEKIKAFERDRISRLIMLWSYCAVGFFLSMAVIAFVAYNWFEFGDILKICGDFSLFGVIVFFLIYFIKKKNLFLSELFIILSFFMIGVTIGLAGQIFQLGSGWRSFALSWSLLGLPYVGFARTRPIGFVWWIIFLTSFDFRYLDKCSDFFITCAIVILLGVYFFMQKLNSRLERKFAITSSAENVALFLAYAFALFFPEISTRAEFLYLYSIPFLAFIALYALAVRSEVLFGVNLTVAGVYALQYLCKTNNSLLMGSLGFVLCAVAIFAVIWILTRVKFFKGGSRDEI